MIESAAARGVLCLISASVLAGCGALAQAAAGIPPNQLIINGILVPPDPGPANGQTLAGIDANHNGVRDDVERAIAAKYGANKQEWRAVFQAAQAVQLAVVADGEASLTGPANVAGMRAGDCLGYSFDEADMVAGDRAIDYIFYMTADTSARLAAFNATQDEATPDVQFTRNEACQ